MVDKSLEELMNLISYNNCDAMYELSMRFYYGNGVEKNYEKSFEYMLKAANLGMVEAQFGVGYKYFHEKGTQSNDKEMIRWLSKAAEQNDDMAEWLLGIIYIEGKEHGIDTEEKIELGIQLLMKSAEKGNEYAKKKLKQLSNLSNPEKDDNINTGATLKFYRDYTVDNEDGQLVTYDRVSEEFNIKEDSILNIDGNGCNTTIKIKKLTDEYVEIEIEDSHIFIMEGNSLLQTINTKIPKGKKYEYCLPSSYLIRIEYI